MQRPSLQPSRTRYLGPVKDDISIASMLFFMSSTEPAPMRRHAFTGTRPGAWNTGFTASCPGAWLGWRRAIGRGRPSRLSASDRERLRSEIRRSPRELGYDQNLWDGLLLSHHLEEQYAISLSVRQCQRLFHRLGFTLQRPRRQAHESDPLQQEAFKKTSPNG